MKELPRICIVMEPWERATFLPDSLIEEIKALSTELCFAESGDFADAAAWQEWLREKRPEVLISSWTTPALPENSSETVPQLKYLCHLAGSVKGIISQDLLEKGLLVTNWGNSVSRTIAETGLMLAIGALRRVSHWAIEMHLNGGWKDRIKVQTGSLFGRRVGLHGFGAISRELTRLLKPFEVPVATFSPSVPDSLLEEYGVQRAESLEALFSENDVIIELAALTPKNRGMVTEKLLRSIPAGGVFVNVGRGAVVDEAALARVADDGHIQIALDVFEKEPLPKDSPLRKNPAILLLPHLGGPTIDRRVDSTRLGIENLRRYLAGESLEAQVTPEVFARST